MDSTNKPQEKKKLREQLRHTRKQLSAPERHAKSHLAATHFIKSTLFSSHHIACYLTQDAEVETAPLLSTFDEHQKNCYLPILQKDHMFFVRYQLGDTLIKNHYSIPEPNAALHEHRPVNNLDIVIAPLVGFDLCGGRLGMGGGFYDRSLANVKPKQKPLVVGLAFDCQRADHIPMDTWDVKLDYIVTESGLLNCKHRKNIANGDDEEYCCK